MTCPRHPTRPAGRRCTRCGRPACEECLVQAAVGSHCVDCAKASRPDVRTRARYWSASKPALVTYTLIAVNIAVYVGVALWTRDPGALTGTVTDAHLDLGLSRDVLATQITWVDDEGQRFLTEPDGWYRLVTSGFMHFGFLHLAFNMYFLYVLGPMLERPLGRMRFTLLYFASLLGGSFGVVLTDSGITAGASGAVFGLLGAAAIGLWRRGVNPFSTSIGTVLLFNIFITFLFPGISIGGHLGGLAAGAACAVVMLAPDHRRFPEWATYATPIIVGVVSVVGSVLLVNSV